MQHQSLLSRSLVLTPALSSPLNAKKHQSDAFTQGYLAGIESYTNDVEETGKCLQTPQDAWQFLSGEISPEVIEREQEIDPACPVQPPAFPYKAGFIAGYLSAAFSPEVQR
jgi:hypothetical protein